MNRRQHGLDADPAGSRYEVPAVGTVAIPDQESRLLAPRGGLDQLSPDPFGCWVHGHVAMLDAAPGVREYVTYAIDLGVIFPTAASAGVLVLRGRAQGYVLAASLLVTEVLLAPIIAL